MRGGEPRRIVWDDEAGTVEGDHSAVARIRRWLSRPERPLELPSMEGRCMLEDPEHRAEDFLVLLDDATYTPSAEPGPLPEDLRGVVPTPWEWLGPGVVGRGEQARPRTPASRVEVQQDPEWQIQRRRIVAGRPARHLVAPHRVQQHLQTQWPPARVFPSTSVPEAGPTQG